MTTITKLGAAPTLRTPTDQSASRDAVAAILDGAVARQVHEIDEAITALNQIKTEMLQDHAKAKVIIERHFDAVEQIAQHTGERRKILEQMRAERAALVNAKVAE